VTPVEISLSSESDEEPLSRRKSAEKKKKKGGKTPTKWKDDVVPAFKTPDPSSDEDFVESETDSSTDSEGKGAEKRESKSQKAQGHYVQKQFYGQVYKVNRFRTIWKLVCFQATTIVNKFNIFQVSLIGI
jgi:hypothetical protein